MLLERCFELSGDQSRNIQLSPPKPSISSPQPHLYCLRKCPNQTKQCIPWNYKKIDHKICRGITRLNPRNHRVCNQHLHIAQDLNPSQGDWESLEAFPSSKMVACSSQTLSHSGSLPRSGLQPGSQAWSRKWTTFEDCLLKGSALEANKKLLCNIPNKEQSHMVAI